MSGIFRVIRRVRGGGESRGARVETGAEEHDLSHALGDAATHFAVDVRRAQTETRGGIARKR